MTPIWVESIKATLGPERARLWYGDKFPDNGRTNFVERLRLDIYHSDQTAMPEMERPRPGNWENGEATDLRAWQKYYRVSSFTNQPEKKTPFYYPAKAFINSFPVAPQPQSPAADVLLALSKYDPVIEELRRASQLPYSRFPLEYDKDDPAAILLPHLAALKRSSQMLQLRAVAELQAGRSDQALADIKLNFRLMEAVRSEPFIISQLVRFAILQLTLQPVYEGLAEHRWSDAQLVELEGELAKLDCLQDYAISIRCEPAAHIKLIDYMERDRGRGLRLLDELDRFDLREDRLTFGTHVLFYLAPKGWFYQNELRLAQLNQQWNQPMVDATKRVVVPQMAQEHKAAEAKLEGTPYGFLAQTLLPWLGTYAQKTALAQNAADMARVALALERSRLAHGNYPETLEGLAPQFIATLPHDVIGGGPLKYRRTSDGRFVLYSIGWNEKDDGGVVVFDQGVRDVIGNFNRNEGDWDWQYPK
ncbi:MAG: hypothetical protein JF609_03815 [Verrucomicrobia bacterium]|nr:hypothetical protein [Verrucomicrobiota bacterium]